MVRVHVPVSREVTHAYDSVVNQVIVGPWCDVGDLCLKIVWIYWFIHFNFVIVFMDDVVVVVIIGVGVGVDQAIGGACFTIMFMLLLHVVVTVITAVVTGGGV
jgi:hypothetical protein